MASIMMFNRVSADGNFTDRDGGLSWVVPDDEIDQAGASASGDFDTILFGRRTFDAFESFWPHVVEAEGAADPHVAGRKISPAMLGMARWIHDARKIVFSRTRKESTWKNCRFFERFDPGQIETLKKQSQKNMIIFGSGSIVSTLAEHGLIDEYRFVVGPVLLGSGKQAITGLSKLSKLKLVEAKPYRSGNVILHYARSA